MFVRNCPKCGKELSYSKKFNLNKAIKNNSVCVSCSKKGEKNPFYGKTLSEETRRNISEKMKGEKHPFYGKTHSEETLHKMSDAKKGKTLPEEHRRNISISCGGNGELNTGRYDHYELSRWSKAVKDRDKCCQICGSRKKLHAHHIIPKAKWLSGAYLLNNGVTLCSICHIEEHQLNPVNCFLQID